MWELLIAVHLAGITAYTIFLRKSAIKNVDKWALAALLQTAITLPFIGKALIAPPALPAYSFGDLLIMAITVILLILVQFFGVKASQHLEASVAAVLFNTRIFFAAILGAIFLSEYILPLQIVGGVLIFAAIVIVRQKASAGATKLGLLYEFLFVFTLCGLNICEKILIVDVGYEQYVLPTFIISSLLLWVITFFKGARLPRRFLLQYQTLLLMVSRVVSGIGYSAALVFGPVTLTTCLSSLSVISIMAFGIIFLGERDYLGRKIIAAGFAAVGATLILLNK